MTEDDYGVAEMTEYLNELNDNEFRQLFSRLMEEMEFSIKFSRRLGDQLLMEGEKRTEGEEGENYVISIKRGFVNPRDIQMLVHQKKDFNGMFISTLAFSEEAQDYGEALEIELVDGNSLIKLLKKFSLLGGVQRKRDADQLEKETARFLPSVGELENLMDAGLSAMKRGNFDQALDYADQVISLKPNYDLAFALRARIMENMGEWEQALDAYKNALLCNIGDAELWLSLGSALYNLDRHDEELEAYDQALEIDSDFVDAWLNKGATLHKLGRFEEAIECYDQVLKKSPRNAEILNNKAVALKAIGDDKKALTFYSRAVEANPDFVEARLNKVLLLQDLGKKRDAVKELEKALEKRPGNAKMWFLKGSINLDLKQKKQAVVAFEKVLELDPEYEDGKKMLTKAKRLRVPKKVSKDDYPCLGEYEKGDEGCEECGVKYECKEKAKE
ncbi:MAG: tetratricopeptide repeat protein [Methanobacteriota archaeon]|nr:MAG: tetratricopeptide repeat protein [Euryarchaeota archaeon]